MADLDHVTHAEHPANAHLRAFAELHGIDLAARPTSIERGAFRFLIWGAKGAGSRVVYWNERDGEVGQAVRSWAESYAQSGLKPDTSQHGDA